MKLRLEQLAVSSEFALDGPISLGRQDSEEARSQFPPLQEIPGAKPRRILAGWNAVPSLSRDHVLLTPITEGRVNVKNTGKYIVTILSEAANREKFELKPNESHEVSVPFGIALPTCSVRVNRDLDSGMDHLLARSLALQDVPVAMANLIQLPGDSGQLDRVFEWVHQTMGVIQMTVGSADFEQKALEAMVKIVGLHSAALFRRQNNRWDERPVAVYPVEESEAFYRPSPRILDTLIHQRGVVWEAKNAHPHSTKNRRDVVAAPLQDAAGEVIGALYGQQSDAAGSIGATRDKWKALMVDLLAGGVSAGLVRKEKELDAAKMQERFEQFFSKPLAQRLQSNPGMLGGKKADVTVLFCDIRRFSTFSEKLGPEKTTDWLRNVLGKLSQCVLDEEGVLVDYIGDEMMAMWGAPLAQADQTERAVRAGLAMIRALRELNARWEDQIGGEMDIGVGINRGSAIVGNVGSDQKFKYGAIGPVVNIASRVQGMTKHLKRRLLVTRSVQDELKLKPELFPNRRVVKSRLFNIDMPVDLYEVAEPSPETNEFFRRSEAALDTLEKGDGNSKMFAQACHEAGELLTKNGGDGPLQLILSRAADALMKNGEGFSRVWAPPGK